MYSPKLRETPGRDAAPGFLLRRRDDLGGDPHAKKRDQPAAVGNDRGPDLPVSGLLFTGNGATVACDVQKRGRLAGPRKAFAYGECYSAMVRTTLEVGRVSPGAPPVLLTTLRTCSSYEAIVVTGNFGFIKTTL